MELALVIAKFLAPFLPHLLKLGQPVADAAGKELGKKMGEGVWERAKALWSKLLPKIEAKEAAKEAVEDVAQTPDDESLQTVLKVQLEKLLAKDENLLKEIAKIMKEQSSAGINQVNISLTATGEDAQQIGQVGAGAKVVRDVKGNVSM